MTLDFSKIEFDSYGRPETPELMLQTLSGESLGILPGVSELEFSINFSETSEMTFDISAFIDGVRNPMYDLVTGYKIVYTKCYGVYVVMNPETESDGLEEVKHVTCYSREKMLDTKILYLEEGTFNFYNPVATTDTIMDRILELVPDWSVGYVDSALIGRYRTFDSYDDNLLTFIYDTAPEKYRCIFVFDTYDKTISAYDADTERSALPIYLDFENLVDEMEIEEMTDELYTAICPYGSDSLDIRAVNPIGTNWIYDLSYFIANGDIPEDLASRWQAWQRSIINNQEYYAGLVALQYSGTAQLLALQAELTDLEGELETLIAQQSVTIQALAMETTDDGIAYQEELLAELYDKIEAKEAEIEAKEAEISEMNEQISGDGSSSYATQIANVVSELSFSNYFTEEEQQILSMYFIEMTYTEETFVASSVDTSVSGTTYDLSGASIAITDAAITEIDLTDTYSKTMYTVAGGTFDFDGDITLSGDIIRGTLEVATSGSFVLSLYTGTITSGSVSASSGTITVAGTLSGFTDDVAAVTVDEVTTYEGTTVSFSTTSGSMFLTANVSDYQKYSVQMELYEYAAEVLGDLATPTYEFSVDTGNFLFAQEFEPFRKNLAMGNGVYLKTEEDEVITPILIGVDLEFEDYSKLSLTFSNRFKRHDYVATFSDLLDEAHNTARSLDVSKYIYNQASSVISEVTTFLNNSLDAAVTSVLTASGLNTAVNGAGITVSSDDTDYSTYQLRITNNMIAMTDDNWQTAKLAIGLFTSDEIGTYWGINTEVLGGKLLIGNNLILESEGDTEVKSFRFDSTGAWLYNATFILQSDSGGNIILAPDYGIAAGTSTLFTTSGTTVTPSFIDDDGNITFDSDGMPTNANFFLDLTDGSAYLRGTVCADAGYIGGWTLADDLLYGGESSSNYVALNGSGTNTYSSYAFWAGASTPSSAPFWVKKDGSMSATDGSFSGTLYASDVSGALTGTGSSSWIEGCGIRVGSNSSATKGYNFYVDRSGNVWMEGNLTLADGSITWDSLSDNTQATISAYAESAADDAVAGLTLSASNKTTSSTITLSTASGVTIDSATIRLTGYVTFSDIEEESSTVIYGGNIDTSTLTLDTLYGDTIYLMDDDGANAARFYTTGASSYSGRKLEIRSGAIEMNATYGDMYLTAHSSDGDEVFLQLTNYMVGGTPWVKCNGYFTPDSDAGWDLGRSSYRWDDIYAQNDTISTSDRNAKKEIDYDLSQYEALFDALAPCTFQMTTGKSGRTHCGMIAQDVEESLEECGLSSADLAAFIKSPKTDETGAEIEGEYIYGLRYGEFIGMLVWQVQELKARVAALEAAD